MNWTSYAIPVICIVIWVYYERNTKNKSWSQIMPSLIIASIVVIAFLIIKFFFLKR